MRLGVHTKKVTGRRTKIGGGQAATRFGAARGPVTCATAGQTAD